MRRTLLLSGILGLFTGYLFGRSKLRRDLLHAQNAAEAMKTLALQMAEDSAAFLKDLREHLQIPLLNKKAKRAAPIVKSPHIERPRMTRSHRRHLTPVAERRPHIFTTTQEERATEIEREQIPAS